MCRSAKESSGNDIQEFVSSVLQENLGHRPSTSAVSSLGDNNNYDSSSLLLTQPFFFFPITMFKVGI